MKKLLSALALAVVSLLGFTSPVLADSPGQLSNGPDNYKVRNVTQNGAYGRSTSAACNETVKYSVTLANSDFGLLRDVTVKAALPTGAINASAKNVNNETTAVSGSVTVNAGNGSLTYVPGTTVRITSDGQTRTPLSDGVAAGGVNAGQLNGSSQMFVQFEAKVQCSTPPVTISVCELATKKIVTINEADFNSSKYTRNLAECSATPPTPPTPPTPTTPVIGSVIPNTGAEGIAALVAGTSGLAAAGHQLFMRRRK
ncbi:hypothetical protein KA025_02450 [Candidatus Saccharibacteria bacterium]|nr:hypothetical protein [Candidatus Saccharibacteria bacterium]